uniref:Uncharacterized protein n=1 Tax=Kalanchoe fedtschenkoi TaxID=63787 RepID=A0A7N1A292_KALFE
MKKALRCCISCILPCGALDVIRIVHASGRVEEISGSVKAYEVMKAYPKHVLKKPTSWSSMEFSAEGGGGGGAAIVILPPDAQLQRGKIYFLMPVAGPAQVKSARRRRRLGGEQGGGGDGDRMRSGDVSCSTRLLSSLSSSSSSSDQYLSEILSEKLSTQRDRRRGRVGVWRPHLESICESPGDCKL